MPIPSQRPFVNLRQIRVPLFDRIGIHVGEVVLRSDGGTLKPRELSGIQHWPIHNECGAVVLWQERNNRSRSVQRPSLQEAAQIRR